MFSLVHLKLYSGVQLEIWMTITMVIVPISSNVTPATAVTWQLLSGTAPLRSLKYIPPYHIFSYIFSITAILKYLLIIHYTYIYPIDMAMGQQRGSWSLEGSIFACEHERYQMLSASHPNPTATPTLHDQCAVPVQCLCVRVNLNVIGTPPHPNPTTLCIDESTLCAQTSQKWLEWGKICVRRWVNSVRAGEPLPVCPLLVRQIVLFGALPRAQKIMLVFFGALKKSCSRLCFLVLSLVQKMVL